MKQLLQNFDFSDIKVNDQIECKCYVIHYSYLGCTNFFEHYIYVESEQELMHDVIDFINGLNKGNEREVGNWIDLAIVNDYRTGEAIFSLEY